MRFEVTAPAEVTVTDCNCSMCRKLGYLHLLVEKPQFRLLQGEEFLATYTFNTGAAKHYFCKVCGVKSFYVPRSHPDGYSVNLRCLDVEPKYRVRKFDGANWDSAAKGRTW